MLLLFFGESFPVVKMSSGTRYRCVGIPGRELGNSRERPILGSPRVKLLEVRRQKKGRPGGEIISRSAMP